MNQFPLRELNGELIHDWLWWNGDRPDTKLAPRGGPFSHRFVSGVCRVCGYDDPDGCMGCPVNVDMAKIPERPGLNAVQGRQLDQTVAALQAIWAADKAAKEEAIG